MFAPGGILSARVVGSFELIASVPLLAGASKSRQHAVQVLGVAMDLGVISGAIYPYLFTPLGVGVGVVNTDGSSDGGEQFMLACCVWVCRKLPQT